MLDSRHLTVVCAIADAGSVTHAARRLRVTQPALSHSLADVESKVGAPLFVRGRTMTLTPAGERVVAVARRVLGDLASLAPRPEEPIELRVSTGCYTSYHWLPRALARFRARHPDAAVRIALEATQGPLEALTEARIDLALTTDDTRRKALHATPLFEDELVAVLAEDHPLARRASVSPKELARQPLLTYDAPLEELDVWTRFLRPARQRPESVSRVPLTEAIAELARARVGVGVLSRWSVAPYLERGGLCMRGLGPAGVVRTWFAVRRADDPHAVELDALAQEIRTCLPGERQPAREGPTRAERRTSRGARRATR